MSNITSIFFPFFQFSLHSDFIFLFIPFKFTSHYTSSVSELFTQVLLSKQFLLQMTLFSFAVFQLSIFTQARFFLWLSVSSFSLCPDNSCRSSWSLSKQFCFSSLLYKSKYTYSSFRFFACLVCYFVCLFLSSGYEQYLWLTALKYRNCPKKAKLFFIFSCPAFTHKIFA